MNRLGMWWKSNQEDLLLFQLESYFCSLLWYFQMILLLFIYPQLLDENNIHLRFLLFEVTIVIDKYHQMDFLDPQNITAQSNLSNHLASFFYQDVSPYTWKKVHRLWHQNCIQILASPNSNHGQVIGPLQTCYILIVQLQNVSSILTLQ